MVLLSLDLVENLSVKALFKNVKFPFNSIHVIGMQIGNIIMPLKNKLSRNNLYNIKPVLAWWFYHQYIMGTIMSAMIFHKILIAST